MSTYFERLCGDYLKEDQIDQSNRFLGPYRALVVDTDDPLSMGRIRFKCPDMHDYTLKPEECPWALPAMLFGGKSCGNFEAPYIGDYVWIEFEKNNPYAPLWRGIASPTRLNYYPIPFVSQKTPPPNLLSNTINKTDINSRIIDKPDYDEKYLPKDGRPYSQGTQTRYGNIFLTSGVGYYPIEHYIEPAPLGVDPIQKKEYDSKNTLPLVNEPDKKYSALVTKYGNMIIMSDVGYWWNSDGKIMSYVSRPGNTGEFTGDFVKDREFEIDRWLYLQRLINEDRPCSWGPGQKKVDWNEDFGDQRRIEFLTRYGNKIEMRDVGWAMPGIFSEKYKFTNGSTSRENEYSKDKKYLSVSKYWDFRWIKIRTKAGMLFQAYDRGSNVETDTYVNRPLIQETGHRTEREDKWWWDRDARWMRMVTRHGFKMVLDDRGTDDAKAEELETPRGNGFIVKGRRTPGAKAKDDEKGNQKGFYFEFNENDLLNRTVWGSPLGQAMELNDRYQYIMIASRLGDDFAESFRGIEENEFNPRPIAIDKAEERTHHLKIDLDNEYIRLKTRAGNGIEPKYPAVKAKKGIQQGLEMHDGLEGDGPWVELVDLEDRGIWMSTKYGLTVIRGKGDKYIYIDDNDDTINIYNQNNGVKVYASGDVDLTATGSVNINAAIINLVAPTINMSVKPTIVSGLQAGAQPLSAPEIKPKDRGKIYNGEIKACPIKEIQHTYTK